jgi:hypothetical protein
MRKLLTTVIVSLALAAGLAPPAIAGKKSPPKPTDPVPCLCPPYESM